VAAGVLGVALVNLRDELIHVLRAVDP
jgi:hypothetical protein